MSKPEDDPQNQLASMKRIADMLTTAHSYLRDRYLRRNRILNSLQLIVSAFLLSFVMASDDLIERTVGLTPDQTKWVLGISAAASFSLNLIYLVAQPGAKASAHDHARRHYTKAHHEIKKVENGELASDLDNVQRIREHYLDDVDLPMVPERDFLKVKQWHLQKVIISKELDKNPHEPIWLIRLRLWLRTYRPLQGSGKAPVPPLEDYDMQLLEKINKAYEERPSEHGSAN